MAAEAEEAKATMATMVERNFMVVTDGCRVGLGCSSVEREAKDKELSEKEKGRLKGGCVCRVFIREDPIQEQG